MSKIKEPLISNEFDGSFLHKKLTSWYTTHERPLPWRLMWKKYKDPWHIWVSEIMLQQTVIKAVIPRYESFLKIFPSPKTLAQASTDDIRLAVRGLGYYRRFDLLHKACIALERDKRGMPQRHDEWLELPGIGTYTAAAISSITEDEPQGVVDGNVERVLCRLLDIRTEPNLPYLKKHFKKLMDDLCRIGKPGTVNQAVMELGQTVCIPANPKCDRCPISKACLAFKNSSQHLAPAQKAKINFVEVEMMLSILRYQGKIVLVKRPSDAKFLKGTWGFLTSIASGSKFMADGKNSTTLKLGKNMELGNIKHSITKHKINARVQSNELLNLPDNQDLQTIAPKSVEKSLVSNLDRKAWHLLEKKADF